MTNVKALMGQAVGLAAGLAALFLLLLGAVTPLSAAPEAYNFDKSASKIDFIYQLNGNEIKGRVPVLAANIVLDFDRIGASSMAITMGMAQVRAGVFVATEAIKSESILNTAAYPQAVFVSRKVKQIRNGAVITGDLTLRGVTRELQMMARFFRQQGTDPEDRSQLVLKVRGGFSRRDFGITGYPDLVGDRIDLDILVYINRR
ncbi:MAG: YceI family protein [Rhodobacterales bacterium]|nr:YceI family protein [Rhodobacterales bacterium]